ncbi:MAG: PTS sugar transporter subunit IIC [Clostridium celatum]|nr:PTS sugar transporter subunit IIC [Clostridium celatum]
MGKFSEQGKRISGFLERKNIVITPQRYLLDVLSQMAQAVFASLIIGLIFKTIGEQGQALLGKHDVFIYLVDIGALAMKLVGPAIGVAVAWALEAPPLVLFTSIVTGALGANVGGEAAALISALIGAEFGKMVFKETKVDILVTPGVTLLVGSIAATFAGPLAKALMTGIGTVIMEATELQPFFMGIIVSIILGLVLTSPLSSTALCIMLKLSGISAGAAAIGCCVQMVGFATISYRDCKMSGVMAMGLGSSMFQMPNIIKNPWILLPTILSSAIIAPIGTCIFKMTNTPAGAGMGTCGFVGQIFTFTDMGLNTITVFGVLLLHFAMPITLSLFFDYILRRNGKIKDGDYYLDL